MAEGNANSNSDAPPPPPPPPKKVVNKTDGLMMAGGYIIGWIIFIIVFKIVYGRYRKSQSIRYGRESCLLLYREPERLVW